MLKKIVFTIFILSLSGLLVMCSNFLTGGDLDKDPNRATEVSSDLLFVAIQPNMYGILTGPLGMIPTMFLQQMSGVSQHWSSFELYEISINEFDGSWNDVYLGGGLVDIKVVKEQAEAAGSRTMLGITEVWEALMMGTVSGLWGDMPYSQASQPDEFPQPVYDKQSAIQSAVLALLDKAIADLTAGQAVFDGTLDFSYGGNTDKWIRTAHTIKARFLINWAETTPANYALALAEAQQGISSYDDNLRAKHTTTSGEESMWWQFESARFGYAKTGKFFIDLLKADNDPRLEIYIEKDQDGNYVGSGPGENNGSASWLNSKTLGAKDWDTEIVTWGEGRFIIAEAQYNAGLEDAALATLDAIQEGLEAKWADYLPGYDPAADPFPRYSGLTGDALLKAIMMEKYKALFLNVQIWHDWKRTAYPLLPVTPKNRRIPRRMLYSVDELGTNPNVPGYPAGLGFYVRTESDPGDPAYTGSWPATNK